ncbi:pleckstrin homology domain-containing family M member 1-like [Clytia hemisphaerica]
MFQYLKKAVSGSYLQDPRNSLVQDEHRKKILKDNLTHSIKKLQKTHVNRSTSVIERNDEDGLKVCIALEAIFLHEYLYKSQAMDLKNMFVDGIRTADDDVLHVSFWDLVKEVTHKDVVTQLKHLVVTTDVGLCRSWIRLALNDCLIVSYLDAILADKTHLSRYYAPNAFLMDSELPFILKDFLQGLMHFEFRLNYNSSKLNTWEMEPLGLAGLVKTDKNQTLKGEGVTTDSKSAQTAKLKDVTKQTNSPTTDKKIKHKRGPAQSSARKSLGSLPKTSSLVKEDSTSSMKSIDDEPKLKSRITAVEDLPIAKSSFLERNKEKTDSATEKTGDNYQIENKIKITLENPNNENQSRSSTPKDKEITENAENFQEDPESIATVIQETPPRVLGNRLGGLGWSGWSSQFEEDENDGQISRDVESPKTPLLHKEEFKTFDSLLKSYGNNTETLSSSLELSSDAHQIEDDVVENVNEDGDSKLKGDSEAISDKDKSPATSPTADPAVNQTFEIVPMDTQLQGENVDKRTQSSLSQLTELGLEWGLDKQNFQCRHCNKAIGLIYGPYRVCHFDGGYYCLDCHDDEQYYVPANVISQWEFKKFKVSRYNKLFLMKIEEEPLFHMDELNPKLYEHIASLQEVKTLRQQLQYVKEYIQTCRNEIAEDFRIRLWPREYLCDDIHQYSLLDLIQVHSGQLSHHLKKVIAQFTKHIYKCTLCCQKGFICEYCNDTQIIYPFQIDIAVQCPGCLSTFHRVCRQDKRCPKCVRIHLRTQSSQKDEMERRLTVTSKESIGIGVF